MFWATIRYKYHTWYYLGRVFNNKRVASVHHDRSVPAAQVDNGLQTDYFNYGLSNYDQLSFDGLAGFDYSF